MKASEEDTKDALRLNTGDPVHIYMTQSGYPDWVLRYPEDSLQVCQTITPPLLDTGVLISYEFHIN